MTDVNIAVELLVDAQDNKIDTAIIVSGDSDLRARLFIRQYVWRLNRRAHKNDAALERLHVHLAVLRREGRIDVWFDREILAGGEIDAEIDEQLEDCGLFLLLVSPDFSCFRLLRRTRDGTGTGAPSRR